MRTSRTTLVFLLSSLAACSGGESTPAADSPAAAQSGASPLMPRVVDVRATDYAFEAPDTIPAGATTFRLKDDGKELHHLQIVKLAEGKSFADLMGEMKGEPPAWAVLVGGPNSPIPGAPVTSETALQLEPGNYAMICVIPSPDGKPHIAKGMSKPFTVVPSSEPTALPVADLNVTLTDYAFSLPDSIGAGKHVLKVEVNAAQPHEIFVARLADGKSPEDLVRWVEKMDGPPPATPVGGTSAIAPGQVNYVMLDLAPGEYGIFCFIPDHKDGKMHVAHGMVRRLKVA